MKSQFDVSFSFYGGYLSLINSLFGNLVITIVFLFALAKETTPAQPERFTPLLFRTQHPIVKFSGGRLISILGGNDTETPKCTIAAVQVGRMSQLSQKKKHCCKD